ncbi:uncharacterized protein LOC143288887 [Babylonia areolata]|uniref:uncharacterized protein LOC143288887 n=1 Tax=Babylonia areolata TaxID=304850 RepID=UPI003FD5E8E3
MVFEPLSMLCQWPTSRDVRRCYRNMEGYSRATCERHQHLVLPNPDSCALFIHCGNLTATTGTGMPQRAGPEATATTAADMTHWGHVQECPYPSLFSPVTRRCADFRHVQQLCRGRPVPKAPCDYLQYRQSSSSLQTCRRRHPSCVGMRDGFHLVTLTRHFRLYAKRCFRERTVDVISCRVPSQSSSPKEGSNAGNNTCTRHVYDVL